MSDMNVYRHERNIGGGQAPKVLFEVNLVQGTAIDGSAVSCRGWLRFYVNCIEVAREDFRVLEGLK